MIKKESAIPKLMLLLNEKSIVNPTRVTITPIEHAFLRELSLVMRSYIKTQPDTVTPATLPELMSQLSQEDIKMYINKLEDMEEK